MKHLLVLLFLTTACYSYDFDTTTIETLIIYREHELTYETDTVLSKTYFKSGNQWYIKWINQDYWSDKQPKRVKR